jgi:hypothetical protein
MAPSDLDGDGLSDLLTISQASRRIFWFRPDGLGGWFEPVEVDVARPAWPDDDRPHVLDFDRDGADDFVTLAPSGTEVRVFRGVHGGTFEDFGAFPDTEALGNDLARRSVVIPGDFDGDGWMDVLLYADDGSLHLLRNESGERLVTELLSPPDRDRALGPSAAIAIDADGDRRADVYNYPGGLLVENPAGKFYWLEDAASRSAFHDLTGDALVEFVAVTIFKDPPESSHYVPAVVPVHWESWAGEETLLGMTRLALPSDLDFPRSQTDIMMFRFGVVGPAEDPVFASATTLRKRTDPEAGLQVLLHLFSAFDPVQGWTAQSYTVLSGLDPLTIPQAFTHPARLNDDDLVDFVVQTWSGSRWESIVYSLVSTTACTCDGG